jgi:flagellar export protein FliJ
VAKFRFKLDPVLEQRRRLEEKRMLEVAELERARIAAEDRLRTLQEQIEHTKHDLRERLGLGAGVQAGVSVNLVDVRLQAGASVQVLGRAQKAAIELAGCYQRVERGRQELMRAMTARKAVGILKQRRLEEWQAEQKRREHTQMDEIISSRSAREQIAANQQPKGRTT